MANDDLEGLLTHDMVIEGGHYIIGEAIDAVTEWTWERAVELYSTATGRGLHNLSIMLLVDDFAVETERRGGFRTDYEIPTEYRKILDRHHIDRTDVRVVWEVQLRNRARGDLRARLKPTISWEIDGYFVNCDDGSHRRLTKGTVPACNLLMARHIRDKDRLFKYSLNLYDLRWDCESSGGVVASRALYSTKIIVYNTYISMAQEIVYVGIHKWDN